MSSQLSLHFSTVSKDSNPANDLRQIITDAEHPHLCLNVHFVISSKLRKELKWDPDQNCCVSNRDRNERHMWKTSLCQWRLVIAAFKQH